MRIRERIVETFRVLHPLVWAFAAVFMLLALVSAFGQQKRVHVPYGDVCVTGLNEMQHIRDLALQAIDTSFREHVQKLFDHWLAEPNVKQPERAAAGFKRAIHAYRRARAQAV
mgnify:CR=1 FL=1